ncbi:hypothetical protein ACE0DR_02310 [Azotobacter sp. CWF10]
MSAASPSRSRIRRRESASPGLKRSVSRPLPTTWNLPGEVPGPARARRISTAGCERVSTRSARRTACASTSRSRRWTRLEGDWPANSTRSSRGRPSASKTIGSVRPRSASRLARAGSVLRGISASIRCSSIVRRISRAPSSAVSRLPRARGRRRIRCAR